MSGALSSSSVGTIYYKIELNEGMQIALKDEGGTKNVTGVWLGKGGSGTQFPYATLLPFGEKIRKFRFEVKWYGNFPEIPFGNCGVPSEVLLFFRSERNGGNFLTIC